MKNVTLIVLSLLIGIVLAFSTAWSQEDMTAVDNTAFESPQRSPSVFVHDEHNENADITDCAVCHHVFEDGKLVEGDSSEGQSCSECHEQQSSGDAPLLREAFHTRCIGCHQAENKGPIMCGECHVRKHS
jgi:predicted CXXCH cytochrome family protein